MSDKTGRPVAELMGLRPAGSAISMNEYWWSIAYESVFPSGIDRDNLFNALNMLVTANCAGAKIASHRNFMIDFITGGSLADLSDDDYVIIKECIEDAKKLQKKLIKERELTNG